MRMTTNHCSALRTTAALICLLGLAVGLDADVAFMGAAAHPAPLRAATARLVRAHVVFTETTTTTFAVLGTYVFVGAHGPAVVPMALPEDGPVDDEGRPVASEPHIVSLDVRVDGTPAPVVLRPSVPGPSAAYEHLHTFDVSLAPGRRTTVEFRYPLATTYDVTGTRELPCMNRSALCWSGTVDQAVFEYRLLSPRVGLHVRWGDEVVAGGGRPPVPLALPRNQGTRSYTYRGGPRPVLTLTVANGRLQDDVTLVYHEGTSAARVLDRLGGDGERLVEFLARKRADDDLIAAFSADVLRNLVFARWGYPFTSLRYRQGFYDSGLFIPSTTPFDGAWLTPAERKLVERLQAMGSRR